MEFGGRHFFEDPGAERFPRRGLVATRMRLYRRGMYYTRMPFSYFDRLSAARKVVYLRSDAIEKIQLPPGPPLTDFVPRLERALAAERRKEVEETSSTSLRR